MEENVVDNSKSAIDFLGNTWNYNCMGCAIAKGDIKVPGGIIYEGINTILAADPEIPIPGFLIVNVKKHIRSFSELSKEERYEISNVIALAEKALKQIGVSQEITLVQEERSKHFHIWIFPNQKWMEEKFGKGITYLRAICEYARENNNEENTKEVLNIIEKVKDYFINNKI